LGQAESLFGASKREEINDSPDLKNTETIGDANFYNKLSSMQNKPQSRNGINSSNSNSNHFSNAEIFNDQSLLFNEKKEKISIIAEEPNEEQLNKVSSQQNIPSSSSTTKSDNDDKIEPQPIQLANSSNQTKVLTQIKTVSPNLIAMPQIVQTEPKNIVLPVLNVMRPVTTITVSKVPEQRMTPQLISQSFNSPAVQSILSLNQSLISSASSTIQANLNNTPKVLSLTQVLAPLNTNKSPTKFIYVNPNMKKVLIKKN